jgi:hypothetical protein
MVARGNRRELVTDLGLNSRKDWDRLRHFTLLGVE